MSLINCPECDKSISNQSDTCPHCGFPVKKHLTKVIYQNKKKQATSKLKATIKNYRFYLALYCLLACLFAIYMALPYPNTYYMAKIQSLPTPSGCDSNLAHSRQNRSAYTPFSMDELTPYEHYVDSFVGSNTPEQTQAIKCEIWKEIQALWLMHNNTVSAKFGGIAGTVVNFVVFLALVLTFLFTFFPIRSISAIRYHRYPILLFGSLIGVANHFYLASNRFYYPFELQIIHFMPVLIFFTVLTIGVEMRHRSYRKSKKLSK
jgi:hypothetical protein